jgi:hypothetical protein
MSAVTQYPLKLAWAITTHKSQGQTIYSPKPVVSDIGKSFSGGMSYVTLGRSEELTQNYLLSLDPKKIYCEERAAEEARRLSNIALNNRADQWKSRRKNHLNIVTLNARSLKKHCLDIQSDNILMMADILAINETWHELGEMTSIPNFTAITVNAGRGKGTALYSRKPVIYQETENNETFQVIKISVESLDIISAYRSSDRGNLSDFTNRIVALVDREKPTIVCGDININYLKDNANEFSHQLSIVGFRQLVKEPTHIAGGLLDHFYAYFPKKTMKISEQFIHPLYFSDHDAICYQIDCTH